MSEHLQEAASTGELQVGESRSTVGYKLIATREHDNAVRVKVSVMAPRDWLLLQGFTRDAMLVRHQGAELPVFFDGELEVGDNISVTLGASDTILPSIDAARQQFPELGTIPG